MLDWMFDEMIKVPDKVFDNIVAMSKDVEENWETGTILVCAAIGVSFIIGGAVAKIPVPKVIAKQMIAPVIAVIIVKALAESAERKSNVAV